MTNYEPSGQLNAQGGGYGPPGAPPPGGFGPPPGGFGPPPGAPPGGGFGQPPGPPPGGFGPPPGAPPGGGFGQPPGGYGGPPPGAPPGAGGPPVKKQPHTLAIVSLVAGIAGFTCCFLIGPIVAIVTGLMAKKEIKAKPHQFEGDGLATAGIVLGGISLVLSIIFGILQLAGGILSAVLG